MKCFVALITLLSGLAVNAIVPSADDPPRVEQYAEIVLTVEGMT